MRVLRGASRAGPRPTGKPCKGRNRPAIREPNTASGRARCTSLDRGRPRGPRSLRDMRGEVAEWSKAGDLGSLGEHENPPASSNLVLSATPLERPGWYPQTSCDHRDGRLQTTRVPRPTLKTLAAPDVARPARPVPLQRPWVPSGALYLLSTDLDAQHLALWRPVCQESLGRLYGNRLGP